MFGIYGLAEVVSLVLEHEGVEGCSTATTQTADELALEIVRRVHGLVADRPMPYCEGNGGRALLHSQSGIDSDLENHRRVPDPGRRGAVARGAPADRHPQPRLLPGGDQRRARLRRDHAATRTRSWT